MKTNSRIYIGNHLYRLDVIYQKIIQVMDPDNVIHVSNLTKSGNSYHGMIESSTGKFIREESKGDTSATTFNIPRQIMASGYKEGSLYAGALNNNAQDFNIRYIDEKALLELESQPFAYKHRELPEVLIDGKLFVVDVAFNELRMKGEPENSIRIDLLDIENGKYVIEREDFLGTSSDLEGNGKILIDQLVKLDPDGMSVKYGLDIASLPENDAELRCDPLLLEQRIDQGKLPIIRIVNEDFYVDIRMEQLRSTSNYMRFINLTDKPRTEDEKIILFYDHVQNTVIHVPDTITEIPENLVMVILPNELILDPVACGRERDGDPMAFIDRHPLQHKLEARVFPIEHSYLPYLVHSNRLDAEKKLHNTRLHKQKQMKDPGKKRGNRRGL